MIKNLKYLIIDCLKFDRHSSHYNLEESLFVHNHLKPKKTIFTHMTALIDEKEILKLCPKNVIPGYDGMEINI